MKKFLCVLCALCGLSSFTLALDREAFTFTKYDLDVRIEPEQQRLAVRGAITLRNDSQAAQKNVALQISSSLTWRSIQVSGKPVQFVSQTYTSDIDHTGALSEAIVTLPEAIASKGAIELQIGYEGTISLDTTRLTRIGVPEEAAKHADWDQISGDFTAVRGIGYVAWYPVAMEAANLSEKNSVFDAVATWKTRASEAEVVLKLHYSEQSTEAVPTVLCNGRMDRSMTEEISRARSVDLECSFAPLADAVPTFVTGRYEQTPGRFSDVYYLAGHKALAASYTASTDSVAPFVTDWFGSPRGKVSVADLPDLDAIPFENEDLFLAPLVGSGPKQVELAAARQLAHAAFFSPRPWIREGLTHFAQALYREQQDGRAAALAFMKSHEEIMLAAEKVLSVGEKASVENSLINTSQEEFYRSKAMYVWWMLRDQVGDAALKASLAAYRPEQDKEPSYMQRRIEAQSKKDLEWFFDDWVYRDKGLPDLRVVSVYPRKTMKNTYLVTVTVENLGNAAAEVPVIAHFAGLESKDRLLVKGKSQASIRLETTSRPEEVTVNDGSVPESDTGNNTFKVDAATDSQ